MRKIADKYISEEDVLHPHFTSQTEQRIYNPRPSKPRNHPGVDKYTHAQILHLAMIQYSLRNGLNKPKKFGEAEVDK